VGTEDAQREQESDQAQHVHAELLDGELLIPAHRVLRQRRRGGWPSR